MNFSRPGSLGKAAEKSLLFSYKKENLSALGKIPKPSYTPSTSGTAPYRRISAQFTVTNLFKPTVGLAFAFKPTQLFGFLMTLQRSHSPNSPPLSDYFVSSASFSCSRYSFAPFSVSHEAMYSSSSFHISSSSSSCFLLSRTSSTNSFKVSSSSPIFLVRLSSRLIVARAFSSTLP